MAIRIQYKGLDIVISSPDEAVAFIRKLTTDQGGSQAVQVRDEDRWEATLAFLSAIKDAGTQGAEVTQIMHALGVRAPKGVGSRTTIVDKSLKEVGFTAEEVYDNERTSQGRFWRAGPRLFEAIDFILCKRVEDARKQS